MVIPRTVLKSEAPKANNQRLAHSTQLSTNKMGYQRGGTGKAQNECNCVDYTQINGSVTLRRIDTNSRILLDVTGWELFKNILIIFEQGKV